MRTDTKTTAPTSDAEQVGFSPATSADWTVVPKTVADGLNEIAGYGVKNAVTAVAPFGTDGMILRADGTGRGAQASSVLLADDGSIMVSEADPVYFRDTKGSIYSKASGQLVLKADTDITVTLGGVDKLVFAGLNTLSEVPLKIKEAAAAVADTAAYGQLWVKTATPCQPWYTDDAGTNARLVVTPMACELDAGAHTIGFTMQTGTGGGDFSTTIDWKLGNKYEFTWGAGAETFVFTAPTKPCNLILKMVQDGVGGRDATWPASVKWLGDEPTWTDGGADKTIIAAFFYDGTNYWGQGTPWEV